MIVTKEEDKIIQEHKVEEALKICGYPIWAFVKVKQQMESGKQENVTKRKGDGEKCKGMVVMPLCERYFGENVKTVHIL